MRAIWKETVIAESDATVEVEGNHYFPAHTINETYFRPSDTHTHCGWKGDASYYHIEVDGERNEDAAWYYPEPYAAAQQIRDHVAFGRGVKVTA